MSAGGRLLVVVAMAAVLSSACARGPRAPGFDLRDDRGRPWDLNAQTGGIVLVFGYTHCGDTCPLMLSKLSKALEQRWARGDPAEIVFVSVDPTRDTPNVLHAFVSRFGPGVVGLTGTQRQLESVERAYHVWAQRLPSKNGGYDYDEAHSSTMFFITRNRTIASIHDSTDSIGELAQGMQRL